MTDEMPAWKADLLSRIDMPRYNYSPPKGWEPLIERLHARLAALDPDYKVIQVKEKFGGLRYYSRFASPELELGARVVIAEAEAESQHTCQECGGPGQLVTRGWVATVCEQHLHSGHRGYGR